MNRDRGHGDELVALLQDRTPAAAEFALWDGSYSFPETADIVVDATSVGLSRTSTRASTSIRRR